jgi:YhcH/YjgK/YiaL family protein
MILGNLEHISQQVVLTPNMEKGLHFLRHSDTALVSNGRLAIDGDKVFAIVNMYKTRHLVEMVELEGHKKYIDIQFLVAGQEMIGWASIEDVPVTVPYDASKDFWNGNLLKDQLTWVKLAAGQAIILYPGDAHAAQFTDRIPTQVKKIVVKVAIS